MKIRCPECTSEYLDQGSDDSILCHKCGSTWILERPYNKELDK